MIRHTILICLLLPLFIACSDDDKAGYVAPNATSTFTDQRDGTVYDVVRYGNLEWTVENLSYDLSNRDVCAVYQTNDDIDRNVYSTANKAKYGCLYTLQGALDAVPDGWRLPTDDDWQNLERRMGMSKSDAANTEWRGSVAPSFFYDSSHANAQIGILMGGYYTPHVSGSNNGYRFMGVHGFFWTSSTDDSKDGIYYYYRKFTYNNDAIYRQSMEGSNKLSVRLVRDAQ